MLSSISNSNQQQSCSVKQKHGPLLATGKFIHRSKIEKVEGTREEVCSAGCFSETSVSLQPLQGQIIAPYSICLAAFPEEIKAALWT